MTEVSKDLDSPETPVSSSQLAFISTGNQEIEVMVFLRDRTTLRVLLEDGQFGRSTHFMEIVFQAQKLPKYAEEIFCLWLVSPLLEVRLKPDHQPYILAQQWEDLVDIYSTASEKQLVMDEPMLYFQRDVFYPLAKEMKINDSNILLYLYHEAKYNVLSGRYIVSIDDYHRLAGIQALIHLQHFDPKTHVQPLYRSHLEQFYPHHLCEKTSLFGWKKTTAREALANQLEDHHHAISEEHQNVNMESLLPQLYRQYLQICWSYPFYGAAFFTGTIEQPPEPGRFKFLRSNIQTDVYIAINLEGLCIIDRHKQEVLMSLPYTNLSWEMKDICEDSLPILLLQFSHSDHTKILTVYSPQAKLMNALIESCVSLKKKALQQDTMPPDRGSGDDKIQCEFKTIGPQLDKLCVCSYSVKGDKLD